MKETKHIVLTFDHELFLGSRSGSVDTCMIQPTTLLQEIFDDFGIEKAVFFLDTTYVSCLKRNFYKQECQKDYDLVKSNIQFLLEKGHYVFPHIHPHWLDAQFVDGNWVLDNLDKYTFNACSNELRSQIWKDSIQVLNDFNVSSYHSIDSFRAGGWSIQPFKDFKPFFEKYGILNDFTVLPRSYFNSDAQNYDFKSVLDNSIYQFDNEVTKPVEGGNFYEFPISTKKINSKNLFIEKLFKKYLWKTNNRSIGDGQSVVSKNYNQSLSKKTIKSEMISIELLNIINLRDYKRHLNENNFIHFVSHPKMLSLHNLKVFRKYLRYATNKYNINFDFKLLI